MLLPKVRNVSPSTLGQNIQIINTAYMIPMRKCCDCGNVINIIDDEFETKPRMFLWVKLETDYRCCVCMRDNKIRKIFK
jgi:hypothetical protein